MENTLYLECYSGISGDMTVGALLDLGASQETLMQVLKSLPVKGFEIEIKRVKKSGIDACDFRVILDEMHENHDHDMEYLYGKGGDMVSIKEEAHSHTHALMQEEDKMDGHMHRDSKNIHNHTHGDNEQLYTYPHQHRGMKEIEEIIRQGQMTENARRLAIKIFEVLAQAEAEAHAVSLEEVHFHEVGAVDSIVDIIAVAVCLDNLNITNAIVTELWEGTGTVRCQHGILPVPVPAVANIVKDYSLNLHIMEAKGEFVTPTGAAIAATVKTSEKLPKEFKIQKIGIGAGKRNYEQPGILRAMLIEKKEVESDNETECKDHIYKLESNMDDCSGEALGYVMERLFEAGARDVHYIPVFMKKNRPAWQITVICEKDAVKMMEQIIFEETTTIGIRRIEMERTLLRREQIKVVTSYGEAEVKVCSIDGVKRFYPEYESVVRICKEKGLAYTEVYQAAVRACKQSAYIGKRL